MPSANRRFSVRAVPTIYVRFDSRKLVFRQLPVEQGAALEVFERDEAVKRYGAANVAAIESQPDTWLVAGARKP
jgi:hypothetical protein